MIVDWKVICNEYYWSDIVWVQICSWLIIEKEIVINKIRGMVIWEYLDFKIF